MKSGWSYEKTSSDARRPDRTGHRWSVHWFSGRSEGSRRTDRQSGRSGIWPRYPDGLGTWADRIGARKFKLRHYPASLAVVRLGFAAQDGGIVVAIDREPTFVSRSFLRRRDRLLARQIRKQEPGWIPARALRAPWQIEMRGPCDGPSGPFSHFRNG